MNAPYNPLLRATRAAFAELTTLEARAWYRTQAKATAAVAMAIAHNSIATITRLLKPKPVPEVVADVESEKIALAEATAPEQTNAPAVWLALEANEGAVVNELQQAIALTTPKPEQNDQAAKVYFMHSSDQAEKVAAMQLKYNIKPLDAEREVKPHFTKDESTVVKPSQFQDKTSLLTYYALLNLEQNQDAPLDAALHELLSDQTIASAQVQPGAANINAEANPLDHAPANWLALEANDSAAVDANEGAAVDEPAQAIAHQPESAAGEVQPESSELEQEPTPSAWAWAATDVDDVYQDEPLPEEDEATENLPQEDTAPTLTQLPSDLSSLIQDYMQKNGISAEPVADEAIAHPSSAPTDSPGGAAAFAWEEHQVDSDCAAGADAGD